MANTVNNFDFHDTENKVQNYVYGSDELEMDGVHLIHLNFIYRKRLD